MAERIRNSERRGTDWLIAGGLWAVWFTVAVNLIGVHRHNIGWFNFVFDADPSRVLTDALQGQNQAVFERHPLFALIIDTLARGFSAFVDAPTSVLWATASLAAAGVAGAFVAFRGFLARRDALLFTLLYACSASMLVLSSLPETFAITSALIVGVFLFQRLEVTEPRKRPWPFIANVIFAALAIGIAVPNVVYIVAGYANRLRGASGSVARRVRLMSGFVVATLVCFGLFGAVQRAAYPEITHGGVAATPVTAALRDAALRFDRPFGPGDIARNVRAFAADNVIAPYAGLEVSRQLDGPLDMIQFVGRTSAPYLLTALLFVALLGVVIRWDAVRAAARRTDVQLAVVFIAYNVGFHYFYRANGTPFIFSTHTVFPVLLLVAVLYASSAIRWRPALLAACGAMLIVNNGLFVSFVRRALDLNCATQVGNVCLRWTDGDDTRLTRGVDAFRTSADYVFEQGRVEFVAGHFEAAIPKFRSALAMEREYPLASVYLGAALVNLRHYEEAVSVLTPAASQDPGDRDLSALLGTAIQRRDESTPLH